jgi:pimeloyl-ACP methyl ester carboxylesterase
MRRIATLLLMISCNAFGASEDVRLDTELGRLSGTLETPDTGSPQALILFISGSGPTDRDGNSIGLPGKNNSLRYLSDALVESGYATLRFDKRLIGESATRRLSEEDLRFDTYIGDVRLWAAYGKDRFDLPLYVLGHSEGSLIGIVAAQELDVAGLISIAGPGRRASDVILSQTRGQLPPDLMQQTEHIVSELLAGRTVDDPPRALAALFRESVQPYLISWFSYDPAEELSRLEVPVLLVYGTTDIQVPVSDAIPMQTAKPSSELVVIEDMNHVLKYVGSDMQAQVASYSDPDLPVADALVEQIVLFLQR